MFMNHKMNNLYFTINKTVFKTIKQLSTSKKEFSYLDKTDDTNKPWHIRRNTFDRTDKLGVLGSRVCGGLCPHGAVTGVHGGWGSVAERVTS